MSVTSWEAIRLVGRLGNVRSLIPVIVAGIVALCWRYDLSDLMPVRDVRAVVLVMMALTGWLCLRLWDANRWFSLCVAWVSGIALWRILIGQVHYGVGTTPFFYFWGSLALGIWAYEARCGKWISWLGWGLLLAYGSSILIGIYWKPWPHIPTQADFPFVGLADNQPNATYILAWSIAAAAPYAAFGLLALPFLAQTMPVASAVLGYLAISKWWVWAIVAVAVVGVLVTDPPQLWGTKDSQVMYGGKPYKIPTTQDWIRVQVWEKSVEVVGKKWLTGYGLGSYRMLSPKMWPPGNPITYTEQWRNPNNILVSAYFEGGIVGLALFLSGILSLLWRGITRVYGKCRDENVTRIVPVFICVMVMALFYEVPTMPSLTALAVVTLGAMQREVNEAALSGQEN